MKYAELTFKSFMFHKDLVRDLHLTHQGPLICARMNMEYTESGKDNIPSFASVAS